MPLSFPHGHSPFRILICYLGLQAIVDTVERTLERMMAERGDFVKA